MRDDQSVARFDWSYDEVVLATDLVALSDWRGSAVRTAGPCSFQTCFTIEGSVRHVEVFQISSVRTSIVRQTLTPTPAIKAPPRPTP